MSTEASEAPGRVLVTGGAGFIGHHLVPALQARGHAVTVLDDLSIGRAENLDHDVHLVRGDVRDPSTLAVALEDVRHVFHLAAVVSVRASVTGFAHDADVNVLGTLRLLEAMRGRSIDRAVLASSMAVYAEGGSGTIREDHLTEPASPYGVGKLAAERYWQLLAPAAGARATVLRFFNTYGPGQTPSSYVGVISHFADRVRAGERPRIFGDGEQRRDFVHVEDVVRASLAVLDHDVAGRTFNVGTGVATTVNEVARAILEALGSTLEPEHVPAVPGELRNAVADVTAATATLGYRPSVPSLDLSSVVATLRRPSTR